MLALRYGHYSSQFYTKQQQKRIKIWFRQCSSICDPSLGGENKADCVEDGDIYVYGGNGIYGGTGEQLVSNKYLFKIFNVYDIFNGCLIWKVPASCPVGTLGCPCTPEFACQAEYTYNNNFFVLFYVLFYLNHRLVVILLIKRVLLLSIHRKQLPIPT